MEVLSDLSLKNIMFVSWEKDRQGQNVSAGRKRRRCLHILDKRRWARVSVAKMENKIEYGLSNKSDVRSQRSSSVDDDS